MSEVVEKQRANHKAIWEKNVLGTGNSKCRSPELGLFEEQQEGQQGWSRVRMGVVIEIEARQDLSDFVMVLGFRPLWSFRQRSEMFQLLF